MPGCHVNPKLNLPIKIGTYPIVDVPTHLGPSIAQSILPSAAGVVIQHQPSAPHNLSQNDSNYLRQDNAPIQFPNDGSLKL